MKTNLISHMMLLKISAFVFLMTILSFFYSCTKEELESTDPAEFPCDQLENSILYKATANPEDAADQKISRCVFYATAAITRLMEEESYRNLFLDESNYDDNNELKLSSLFTNTSLKATFDEYVEYAARCSDLDIHNYEDLVDNMVYHEVNYFPDIYYINRGNASGTSAYAIALNSEAYGDDDNDEIPAWYVTSSDVDEVLLDEEEANNANYPILIVNNATDHIEDGNDCVNEYTEPNLGKRSAQQSIADEYKITEKFEKGRKSEYFYNFAGFLTGGGQSTKSYKGEIIKVMYPGNINELIQTDVNIWGWLYDGMWVVTHERDWSSSKKGVYVQRENGAPCWTTGECRRKVECSMKYSDNWYQTLVINLDNQNRVTSWRKGKIQIKF